MATSIPYSKKELFGTGPQRTFRGRGLKEIAFPIGGIGAGSISLGGYGQLRDWEIFNRPGKGNRPAYTFFAISAKTETGSRVTKVVEARPHPPYTGGHGMDRMNGAGLPHLASAKFTGEYPFARIRFRDPDLPVRVSLKAFNPFIPLNAEDSALPVVILKYCLENRGDEPVDATLVGSMSNFIGYDGEGDIGVGAAYYGENVNEVVREESFGGLRMSTRKYTPEQEQYGTLALVTTVKDLTYQTKWSREGWFDELQRFWDGLSSSGRCSDDDAVDPSPEGRTDVGSLGAGVHLDPGERVEIPFLISWHFPTFENYWNEETRGAKLSPHYAARFEDAWAVARYAVEQMDRLEGETRTFHDALFSSTLPSIVLDAVSSQLSTIKTNTCQWYADGTVHCFEGCSDRAGCCMGTCTHVWNYEQTLAFLFPELERDMRVTDFMYDTDDEGFMSFRHLMPRRKSQARGKPAADGQMGCILKLYREWLLSGDRAFLEELWPHAKRALTFAWKGWDADKDGVMEGEQHNTYDIEFHGPNTMMGTFYLGALRAGEELAREMGDEEAVQKYRAVYESGREKLDAELWNGEYYIQKYDEAQAPKYQYGAGCLSDQVLGQWFASLVGLGYTLPRERVRSTLQSIFRYNWRTDFRNHPNCQRIYALNDDAGLLLCSWPKGGRPELPFVYSDEVWTGIEYQVAGHLLYEGFLKEGLSIVKGVRDRHDGERRNPWDEFECGHHYARALASWSLVLNLSGFGYAAPDRWIRFAPKVRAKNFRCFWSVASGWGTFSQKAKAGRLICRVKVRFGRLALDALTLEWAAGRKLPDEVRCEVTCGDQSVPTEVEREDRSIRVKFGESVVVEEGGELRVILRR